MGGKEGRRYYDVKVQSSRVRESVPVLYGWFDGSIWRESWAESRSGARSTLRAVVE